MGKIVVVGRASGRGGEKAERTFRDALESSLPDDWTVFCNVDFLENRRAQEGEADFLCVHRTEGMLLIECKGKGVARGPDGRWYRDEGASSSPMRDDPMKQAQRTIKGLRSELEARCAAIYPGRAFPFVTGHAVAFPRTRKQVVNWPLTWADELVFDCDDLVKIGERVVEALRFWKKASSSNRRPLAPDEYGAFCRRVFQSVFHLAPCTGADMELDRQRLVKLSEEQRRWITGFLGSPRLNVAGSAGTGKTVLAVEAACQLAERGYRTLLLCYTRALANHLYTSVRAQSQSKRNPWVTSFHGLCRYGANLLESGFQAPAEEDGAEERRDFWRTEAPLLLLDAVSQGKVSGFDAIVVDEGQDFTQGWWEVIEELFTDKESARLFVFYDPGQAIFERQSRIPEAPTFNLSINFRNTQAVAELLQRLTPEGTPPVKPHPDAPVGLHPQFKQQGSKKKLVAQLDDEISKLLRGGVRPEDIVLLTPHSRQHSSVAEVDRIAGIPLLDLRLRAPGALTHATISAFKGLEAEVVFLFDIKPDDPRSDDAALYVAASRARARLYVFTRDGQPLG